MKIKKSRFLAGIFFAMMPDQTRIDQGKATHTPRAFEVQKTSSNFPQHTSQRRLQVNNFFLSLNPQNH
jgi:hypothetical protein